MGGGFGGGHMGGGFGGGHMGGGFGGGHFGGFGGRSMAMGGFNRGFGFNRAGRFGRFGRFNRGFNRGFASAGPFWGWGGGWDWGYPYWDDAYYGYGYPDYAYDYGYPAPLVTGRSVATGHMGNYCTTPVKNCELYHASYVGGGCSCRVPGGRARGSVTP